ncbi:MAG TPA: rhomboid family intramembrane serine protease [Gemmataceae bacterium]
MSADGLHPLETILHLCAAAAPEPWYPRLYVKQEGVDSQALAHHLEDLWMSGLIERSDGGPEKGPAISLTREGQRVLLDPDALQRLRAGQPTSRLDRGALIRQALSGRLRAGVTTMLVVLNVTVFFWGYLEARNKKIDTDFLRGAADERQRQDALNLIREKSGSLSAFYLIDGQWWRLLTAGFVHFGFLHLLLNTVFLYLAGRFVEPMWGHVRYLLIYLAGVLGGSCLGVAYTRHAVLLAGASGAICGLLAAEAVWFLFNRRFLPRSLLRQARRTFLVNLVLLIFISSFDNVSGWGHFGGGIAGALTAMLLQMHRFGPPLWRWLAITGFVPLVWYGHHVIAHARLTEPAWKEAAESHLLRRLHPEVQRATKNAYEVYEEKVEPLLKKHPTRRDPDQVEAVLPVLHEQQDELNAVAEKVARTGPYALVEAEEARNVGRDYVLAMAEWFAEVERILRLSDKRTDKDRQALRQQEEKAKEMRQKWNELFE